MQTPIPTHHAQLEELTQFLNERPTFTPVFSDKAILCGFRVGPTCLSLDDVQELLFVPRERRLAALLCQRTSRVSSL